MIAQIRILKSLYETHSSPILNGFSDEISSSTDECDFFKILSDEMFHLLEGLYNSVNQYFPNDDNTQKKSFAGKRTILSTNRPLNFQYKKFTDVVSDSTLQLTFKKLPFK